MLAAWTLCVPRKATDLKRSTAEQQWRRHASGRCLISPSGGLYTARCSVCVTSASVLVWQPLNQEVSVFCSSVALRHCCSDVEVEVHLWSRTPPCPLFISSFPFYVFPALFRLHFLDREKFPTACTVSLPVTAWSHLPTLCPSCSLHGMPPCLNYCPLLFVAASIHRQIF
jgi:hypothetical protein